MTEKNIIIKALLKKNFTCNIIYRGRYQVNLFSCCVYTVYKMEICIKSFKQNLKTPHFKHA